MIKDDFRDEQLVTGKLPKLDVSKTPQKLVASNIDGVSTAMKIKKMSLALALSINYF